MFDRFFYLIVPAAFGVALTLLGSWPAAAADLQPVFKVKNRTVITYQGCGTYFLAGTIGEVAKATVVGQAGDAIDTHVAGASLSAGGGYMCGSADGRTWKFVEAIGSYENLGGAASPASAVPASINSKLSFTVRAGLGGYNDYLSGLLPDIGTSGFVFPAPGANPHPYVFGMVTVRKVTADYLDDSQSQWQVRAGPGIGMQSVMARPVGSSAPPVTLDVFVARTWRVSKDLSLAGNTATAGLDAGWATGALLKF